MERLLKVKRIGIEIVGPAAKQRKRLVILNSTDESEI
jgi:hypothetical protein